MIIVSQDKKSIYNFNNVKSIDVIENEIYITDNILANRGGFIGAYATEERAKEVLEKIIECYSDTESLKCLIHINNCLESKYINKLAANSFIYQMPEE